MRFAEESPTVTSAHELQWAGPEGSLGAYIADEANKTLDAYHRQPRLVDEHANHEDDTARGGYAHRQLFELVQNSADALTTVPGGGRISIRLTETCLYCADSGKPVDTHGVTALMFSHMSPKRELDEIGRFGLGFKSLLSVSDAPEFFSRTGSFRFDQSRARERIQEVVPTTQRHPALRLPDPIDPYKGRHSDRVLRELMGWATNIVRLPLKSDVHDGLIRQMSDFPAEFLLFVEHVHQLEIYDDLSGRARTLELQKVDGQYLLADGEFTSEWKLFYQTHCLSLEARKDRRSLDNSENVRICWAAPLDRLTSPGYFWAYFPTNTSSLVAGILNAPWKTNEDRQNLLPGNYNKELIAVAAEIVAEALPELSTKDDPARHLDGLPRRHEAGDTTQSDQLRERLFKNLYERPIVPDQDGKLCAPNAISYPPKALTPDSLDLAPFHQWSSFPCRPSNWLHHSALSRNRLASIDRLYSPIRHGVLPTAPRATVAEWLQALIGVQKEEDAVQASRAAIQTAATIPPAVRSHEGLGEIVLTARCTWVSPDPGHVFLPDESLNGGGAANPESCVHPKLVSDYATLQALKELGLRAPSPESRFRLVAKRVLDSDDNQELNDGLYKEFWMSSRKLSVEAALAVISELKHVRNKRETWPTKLRVRTRAGNWKFLHSVLLPGEIVRGDGYLDNEVSVDTNFHIPDDKMLHALGATETPQIDRDLSCEESYKPFLYLCQHRYSEQDNLPHNPRWSYLNFSSPKGVGPLEVLAALSNESNALYTDALLNLDACFEPWTVCHTGTNQQAYPDMQCESLTVYALREHGQIRTPGGIVPLADALGPQPTSLEALHALLTHPKSDKIKAVFSLAEPTPELFGEDDPIPLTDMWPGLERRLRGDQRACRLIRCERIIVVGQLRECIFHASNVYLADTVGDDEFRRLQLVTDELNLGLTTEQIDRILHRKTPQEIEEQRAAVRRHSTDAERLLAAVGESALRTGLPSSLLAVLEGDGVTLAGTDVADAAIATYHTDALKQYRQALDYLDPPGKWAGSARAVEFVRLLGFSPEWAGERGAKREPYLEVEGPYSLPELHDYQRTVADNVRSMLRSEYGDSAERRGMISLPTGSGKTRVAVQAIIEAMRHDGFLGGVLWVADRDELCEQAVEAWRQVWSSEGTQATHLRISRLWAGMERPQPTSEFHVIVATIQTLSARLSNQPNEYEFLASFRLVVFDEAHRSIAPTFTSVMQDIGLTRFRKADEAFMLGLTATPYRGRDKDETTRLVRRYGSKRLDSGAFASDEPQDVVRELQDMGVLAEVDHETIEGETFPLDSILDASLDQEELKQILDKWLTLPWLPQSVEERIAQSAERTKRIVEAYETHVDPDWPTLIFATSVEHAKTVAALLNRTGIQSRAVSGETETATRRRVVEEFRRGKIRALVNYGVFREGFDAPKTRAIIVARPVYSPNLYFQMIGRGLRGPLNGGDYRCLILNVRDNIENFDRKLAFSELDWLWA